MQSIPGVGSTFFLSLPFEKSLIGLAPPPAAPTAPLPVRPAAPPAAVPPAARTEANAVPLAAAARPAATPVGRAFQERLRAVGRSSLHILLVEDNPANLRVTQALLETLGCQVSTAMNGIEAVAAYRRARYDLVLMDCQMPEMDGYRATGQIRRMETDLGYVTPIVALTAHAMDGSRAQCLDAGMDDQLSKPLTLKALTDKLAEWLAHARTPEA